MLENSPCHQHPSFNPFSIRLTFFLLPRIDEDHLSTYSHHGIADIRPPCINGLNCNQRFVGIHAFSYSHPPFRLKGISPVNPLAVEIYRGQSPIATVDQPIGINPTPSYLNSRITYFYNAIRGKPSIPNFPVSGSLRPSLTSSPRFPFPNG